MSYDEEADYNKIMGQYRLRIGALLSPLRKYGQGIYVDMVLKELEKSGTQLHFKLSGVDMPFDIEDIHW